MNAARARFAFALLALPIAAASCATLGIEHEEPDEIPNAGIGPFRDLAIDEVGNARVAPLVFDDRRTYARDPSAIDLDGKPSTIGVRVFLAAAIAPEGEPDPKAATPTNAIVTVDAEDGRSFARQTTTVLEASLPWEGGVLGSPSALRSGKSTLLYYAAAGGIGLARSDDGVTFTREEEPVLGATDASSWEGGAVPSSPSVVKLADGTFRMFYGVPAKPGSKGGARIGEASSNDGVKWSRVGKQAVLERRAAPDASGEPLFDDGGVDAPFAELGETAGGRPTLRLYYTAVSTSGARAIGLAGRFLDEEGAAFTRSHGPAYASPTRAASEPTVIRYEGFALLFVTTRATDSPEDGTASILGAVTPGAAKLPPRTEED